jgi:hypothetical protein
MSFDFGSYFGGGDSGGGDIGTINVYGDSAPPSISQDTVSQLSTSLNNQFLTQAPELTNLSTGNFPNFATLPNAAQYQGVANQLIQDQSKMSQTASSLVNQIPQIQQDYANYQKTYNDNIVRYNYSMKGYQNTLNAINYYGNIGNLSNIAQNALNDANKRKAAIDNSFQTYQSAVNTYNNDYKTLQQTYNDYTSTYKDLTNKVTEAQTQASDPTKSVTILQPPDTSTTGSGGATTTPDIGTPVAKPSDPNASSDNSGVFGFATGEAGIPGIGGIGKGKGGTGTGTGGTSGTTAPDVSPITVTPPVDPKEPVAPELPAITVTPPVDKPIAPPAIEDPKVKKVDDWNIEIYPLFPPEKSTLTKTLGISTLGGGGSTSGVGAVLGSGSAPNPNQAPILGKDDKYRQVWNEESLKSALGI